MTVVVAPPYLTQEARRDWDLLQRQTAGAAAFDPACADLLPEPARRWVLHAIAPGTPLLRAIVLSMHGTIRLGPWRRFHASQVLLPLEGFVWCASAYLGVLPVHGFDRYRAGVGEMRWRLLRALPVMSGGGSDITRSAAGRLACEFVLAPAAALDPRVRWKVLDERRAVVTLPVGTEDHEVTLTVAPDGRLESVTMSRWGNPDKGAYREHLFGVECEGEITFDGFTIPAGIRGGWWQGTERWADGEFIRFTIDDALFR
ncbi:DUF6544 family protein [Nonomuraea turcica]|uniref:DUF6544 family protein n=1 Tax=Nonomuraea sp. G32 TaxID=3067274 RepID=UPI00273BC2DE|nr:DUF6544 family protein [Nonomuraea sp. G32]MDP4510074.1 hypothetical protein [Nonomuraea sp. G32]